ncbi:OLC1v1029145C2 [Oldenlandia corymbosa var. corymbosa]|uniref:OLC1v1029145C2 n=1 Tax=Oldenlandia corymbosa var. corymbosa TaxID=529605 RepID=A0AAV1CDN7_OLDCO|nr:OLC1v1029145C2 [Oldenlandia corymbosa var. corymbosa]
MFSIAAINDTDSKGEWEPLAPTKEAQEFHLSQLYHEGLAKLQAKEYEKARELLESVIKDPLVSTAQVENNGSDGHLLQLRFLVLKNLATVFFQQGSAFHENALQCYLQAVEIDNKDSVVWNQLGTLSCSMGLLSISRWAFEQGLLCSPNNWNCMEKLLEVLIAIGDEVACLSVAELILMHWPSHSRALQVKTTIEDSEPVPFSPRGIDKLEPKHIRLKFSKRKAKCDDTGDEGVPSKKLKKTVEMQLAEASWTTLAGNLLEILNDLGSDNAEMRSNQYKSGRSSISIQLPNTSRIVTGTVESKGSMLTSTGIDASVANRNIEKHCPTKSKEANVYEDQPQERRSSRLRSRKPEKDDSGLVITKDLGKVVMQFLRPFILDEGGNYGLETDATSSFDCSGAVTRAQDSEGMDVIRFVQKTLNNYGAYHLGHLLLEEVASRDILYQESNAKLLELEKLTRQWGKERSPQCSLFLAELYYDFGLRSSESSVSEYMSEATYHLCKVIESVALECPLQTSGIPWNNNLSGKESLSDNSKFSVRDSYPLSNNYPFWVRFFWLSGRLSVVDGNKAKAREEFSISLSLLEKNQSVSDSTPICLSHCKACQNLTADRIVNEMSLLEVDFLMKRTVPDMIEKHMYSECVDLLVPLLFCAKEVHLDVGDVTGIDKGFTHVELSAINALIKACERAEEMDFEVCLKCHKRKLQVLMSAAGLGDFATANRMLGMKDFCATESETEESMRWDRLVAEEVKAISDCISRIKSITAGERVNGVVGPITVISDIQSLLLDLMCNVANKYLSKKAGTDQNDLGERCYFLDAAITFCKLQHLIPDVLIKTQTELIVAIHDMLAEFGLCCGRGSDDEEEGTFLKFAIKHLLALDMKLKLNLHTINTTDDTKCSEQSTQCPEASTKEKIMIDLNAEVDLTDRDENCRSEKDDPEMRISEGISKHENFQNDKTGMDCDKDADVRPNEMFHEKEKENKQSTECEAELTEDEREELESGIDNSLDQCFYCLYGLNLRSDSSYEDDLAVHKNTSRGDYQTKEQCADVFQYILPYSKASTRTGLIKIRRVLRAIRKHFPQPPTDVLEGNAIDKFLDDPNLCEDELSEEAGSDGFLDSVIKRVFSDPGSLKEQQTSLVTSSEPYYDVYCNLYHVLALSEEMSATDKWPGFVLTKEGEDFVEQSAKLFKYDLLYNPLRFESWQRLANLYDEEVDLLLNDGSKQINVSSWRKNADLPQRVERSRRRSRRCLLMTLALAKTAVQQGEIHELLALVYYDGIQNVVPFYDQRYISPSKDRDWTMFCQNSMKHFKKAFEHKEDWSHAFYLGKLCEKLSYSKDLSFSYYAKAIALNSSAVDPFYRMHASRLKLLSKCGKHDPKAMKMVASYSYMESTKLTVMRILDEIDHEISQSRTSADERSADGNSTCSLVNMSKLEEVWHLLYNDCLAALEICVEGELKHFHKARYMLAQGFYQRGESGDLEKAKEELSFCFKSSRSSFTINMWEIDSTVKKGRRKAPSLSSNKKTLEVNLAESSRKFITCIRKYILFYLQLLEETGDLPTLDRAYSSLRTDKRFSLCLEDIVPVALGRYVRTLIKSINQSRSSSDTAVNSADEHLLEKIFSLFLEQVNLWSDICSLPDIKTPELTEAYLYGYLYQYIQSLERDVKVEALEGINEKIRKRLKNPKLSNSNCAKVYKNVCVAWCRSLVISMALITPLHSRLSSELHVPGLLGVGSENIQLLCVDLQSDELWSSSAEDLEHLNSLEMKWNPSLSKIKNVIVKRASDEDLETAAILLRSSYNFYKDTSCALLPSGINLYTVPSQLATETYVQPGIDGVDILDMNTSRKLLLWAFTLLHGYCPSLSVVIKYCEENVKLKMKKGTGSPFIGSNASTPSAPSSNTGGGKDGTGKTNEPDGCSISPVVATASMPETDCSPTVVCLSSPEKEANNASPACLLQKEGTQNLALITHPETEILSSTLPSSLPESASENLANISSIENQEIPSSTSPALHSRSSAEEDGVIDLNKD